jgi:hypothetical protein
MLTHENVRMPCAHAARVNVSELVFIPDAGWRLHHVAKRAASAHVLATKASEALHGANLNATIRTEGYALEQAAEFICTHGPTGARDLA